MTEQNKNIEINSTTNTTTEFISAQPHLVTYAKTEKTTTITTIETKCGLVIERGHTMKLQQARRNLKDLFANLQVGDLLNVPSLKEAVSLSNSMRYRGWKASIGKQTNKTYNVQRIS